MSDKVTRKKSSRESKKPRSKEKDGVSKPREQDKDRDVEVEEKILKKVKEIERCMFHTINSIEESQKNDLDAICTNCGISVRDIYLTNDKRFFITWNFDDDKDPDNMFLTLDDKIFVFQHRRMPKYSYQQKRDYQQGIKKLHIFVSGERKRQIYRRSRTSR